MKLGPRRFHSMDTWLAAALFHQLRHDEGMDPVLAVLIDRAIVFVLGRQPTARRAKHHAGPVRQIAGKRQPGLAKRFTRGDQGELREPVIKRDLLAVEQRLGVVVPDLPADLDRQPVDIANIQRTDGTAPLAHRRIGLGHVMSQRVDRARTGDDHPPHET